MAEPTELATWKSMWRLSSGHRLRGCRRTPPNSALWGSLLVLFVCLELGHPTRLHGQPKAASEYEIKAAYLYNFAKFVDWPPSAFSDPKQPLGICIFGRDPFGHALGDLLLGKAIGEHPVSLGYAKQAPDLAGCQIIFLTASEASRLPEILGSRHIHNVLIVGESEGFATAGGTIQFVLDQNRVRFVINPDAADRAGLKISSKLLALALIVHDAKRNAEAKN